MWFWLKKDASVLATNQELSFVAHSLRRSYPAKYDLHRLRVVVVFCETCRTNRELTSVCGKVRRYGGARQLAVRVFHRGEIGGSRALRR
jgi:hypothetical protein